MDFLREGEREIVDRWGQCGHHSSSVGSLARVFGALLDANQLVTPVAFERRRPFVQRPDRLGVRAVEHVAPFAPDVHQADVAQHLQVLRHGRLPHPEAVDDVADGTFVGGEERKDVAPPRLGDGVEAVRRGGGARHDRDHIPM